MYFFFQNKSCNHVGHSIQLFGWLICCLFSFLSVSAEEVQAAEPVYGEYLATSGTNIQLQITTTTPPPSHIIVTQTIPSGLTVVSTQPAAQKVDVGKGVVKWLLKKVIPGSQVLNISLSKPVDQTTLSAVLSYRDPVTGRYVETRVSP